MITIPLGLGTKLRYTPWATIAIAMLWIFTYFVDKFPEHINRDLAIASARSGIKEQERQLFKEFCIKSGGEALRCQGLMVVFWTGFSGHGQEKLTQKIEDDLEDEVEHADKIKNSMDDCSQAKQPKKCLIYKDIIWKFGTRITENKFDDFHSLPAYHQYRVAKSEFEKMMRIMCKKEDCLVKGQFTLKATFLAQIRHASLSHLFGNMLIFVLFGVYVEQRLPMLLYTILVFIGGTVGIAFHSLFFGSSDSFVIGGSANVSAILGMFYVFFFDQKMTFRVILPRKIYFGTSFLADTKYCVPLFFVMSDIAGTIDTGYSNFGTENVAHMAHLSAMCCGCLMAMVVNLFYRLPRSTVYRWQNKDIVRLVSMTDPHQILNFATYLVKCDRDNFKAIYLGCISFLNWMRHHHIMSAPHTFALGNQFLYDNLATLFAVLCRNNQYGQVSAIIGLVPERLPLVTYLQRLGSLNTIAIGLSAASHGNLITAFKIFDIYLFKFHDASEQEKILNIVESILPSIIKNPMYQKSLRYYVTSNPQMPLVPKLLKAQMDAKIQGLVA